MKFLLLAIIAVAAHGAPLDQIQQLPLKPVNNSLTSTLTTISHCDYNKSDGVHILTITEVFFIEQLIIAILNRTCCSDAYK